MSAYKLKPYNFFDDDYNDRLMLAVRCALTDDLRKPKYRGHPNPMRGHCYVASEALYHLWGGSTCGPTPRVMRVNGDTHWFLRYTSDCPGGPVDIVYDPTADQFDTRLDYRESRGCGFLTNEPSSRAQIVIDRVRAGWAPDAVPSPDDPQARGLLPERLHVSRGSSVRDYQSST